MTLETQCSPEEWLARQQLAGCYRVFHLLGWTEPIFNHLSLRVPGTGDERQFLINPYGLHYSEVCASNLVKIDLHGRVLDGSPYPVNPAGFTPHATLHEAIADAHCVMHTYTTAGMAVACSKAGLEISNFYAAQLGGGWRTTTSRASPCWPTKARGCWPRCAAAQPKVAKASRARR